MAADVGHEMNRRSFMAIVAGTCAWFLAVWTVNVLEPIIRARMGMPPAINDAGSRAACAVMDLLLILVFPVFCWLYILPMMRHFLGIFRVQGWRVLVSAFLTAGITWLFFCVLLHSPRLDSLKETVISIGVVVWWPIFAASCAAGCIIAKTVPLKKRASSDETSQ